MDKKLFNSLSCSFCSADLIEKKELVKENGQIIWGLISCAGCQAVYPVVDGIPIIMAAGKRINVYSQTEKLGIDKPGVTVAEICHNIEREDIDKVRKSVIYSSAYEPIILPKLIERMTGRVGYGILNKILFRLFFRRSLEKKIKEVLEDDASTAYQVLKLYYQDHELFNYFFYKFGQPRFLTSLGLTSILGQPEKPILDLACGQGHLMHYLTHTYRDCSVIGLDRNFIQLFLARKYIAPKGYYVCAEADEKLPFKSNTLSSVICSDAFHYFQNKSSCVENLKEIVDSNGAIIITRVGNQLLTPNEGIELKPCSYVRLFKHMQVKVVGDRQVLDRYLKKKMPDLSGENDISQIENEKWLSIVASGNGHLSVDHGNFDV